MDLFELKRGERRMRDGRRNRVLDKDAHENLTGKFPLDKPSFF